MYFHWPKMSSVWKTLRGVFEVKLTEDKLATRNASPLRQCPGCGLYARSDDDRYSPIRCRQCNDVEFLRLSDFVVHNINEDYVTGPEVIRDLWRQEVTVQATGDQKIFFGETTSHDIKWLTPISNEFFILKDPCPQQIIKSDVFERNSWFLDALFLLSERPDTLRNIITENIDDFGRVYGVTLCKNGRWMLVVINDQLPFYRTNLQPLHSRTFDGQLWVSLIEKAAAKICGSYEALTFGGDICDGLEMLTGAPTECILLKFNGVPSKTIEKTIWKKLLNNQQEKYLMMATSKEFSTESGKSQSYNLRSNRNYTILNLVQDGLDYKIELRVLMDENSYPGNSVEVHRDPTFYIGYKDFLECFDVVHVCRLRTDRMEVRIEGNLPTDFSCTADDVSIRRLNIIEKTPLDITIYQNSHHEKALPDRCLTDLSIVVFTERSGHDITSRVNFADVICYSQRTTQGSISLQCQLDAGSYLIACLSINTFLNHNSDEVIKYVMAIRSPIQLMPMRRLQCTKYAFTDALIRLTIIKGVPPLPAALSPGVNAFVFDDKWHGLIVVVENTHPDKFAAVTFIYTLTDNETATRPSMPTKDYVPPRSRRIVTIMSSKQWDRLDEHSSAPRMIVAQLVDSKDPSEDESTPKFNGRIKRLHDPRPMWFT